MLIRAGIDPVCTFRYEYRFIYVQVYRSSIRIDRNVRGALFLVSFPFFLRCCSLFYFTVSWYKGQQRHFDLMHWRNEATLVEYQPIQGTQQLRSFFFVFRWSWGSRHLFNCSTDKNLSGSESSADLANPKRVQLINYYAAYRQSTRSSNACPSFKF